MMKSLTAFELEEYSYHMIRTMYGMSHVSLVGLYGIVRYCIARRYRGGSSGTRMI